MVLQKFYAFLPKNNLAKALVVFLILMGIITIIMGTFFYGYIRHNLSRVEYVAYGMCIFNMAISVREILWNLPEKLYQP